MNLRTTISGRDILKYSFEALIVAFGVVLGLILTQWNLQKKTDKNTEIAIHQIIEETTTNIIKFEKSLAYHEKIAIQFDSIFNNMKLTDLEKKYYLFDEFKHTDLQGWIGIGTANYESVIYESAKINGVYQELNIETIKIITKAYSHMEAYDDFIKSYWNNFISMDSKTTVMDVMQLLGIMRNDILFFERQIVQTLKTTKSGLEQTTHKNTYRK